MLDLVHLKTFVVVVSAKSFNRAAAELGCSQSNVTHQIKMLERELDARLFERFRFSKGVILTDVGRRAYEYAMELLVLADTTKVRIRQARTKTTVNVEGRKSRRDPKQV